MNSVVRTPPVFMRERCVIGKHAIPKPCEKPLELNVLLAAADQEPCEEEAVTNCGEVRPWEKPLDVELLLSAPAEENCEIESVASRDGVRQFTQLPGLSRSDSRPNLKDSFDFEAQFKHVTCEIDESSSSSSDFELDSRLADLIRTRQRKFEKQVLKHAGKDPPATMPQSKSEKTLRSDSSHKLQRSKSFANGVSLGIRSFLARPVKARADNSIPLRLNRLHGANESSMSGLSSTIRTGFRRISNVHSRSRTN